jgi:putative phage-type endonuclease
MLEPEQFVASKALGETEWLAARRTGVTATQVAKGATPSGKKEVVEKYFEPFSDFDNPFMKFGRDQEPPLSMWVKDYCGVMPNDWLIRHHEDSLALATPDGISLGHDMISEVKTTGKDWGSVDKIPIAYKRQVQWQLYVTGAERCVFAWMLRTEVDGRMVPGWFEPKVDTIYRDPEMIGDLKMAATMLWAEIQMQGEN